MIYSVGIDLHKGQHRVYCLDEKAQPCDAFSFQTAPEGLSTLEQRIFRDGSNPIVVFEPAGLTWLMVAAYLRSCHPECRVVRAKGQKVAALRRYLRGPVKSDRIDALTLAKMPFIDLERQEREKREARSIVLRQALERHYADLCSFAQKLDSHVIGETDSLLALREDPMWNALREHLPRSTVWKNLDKWEAVREEIKHLDDRLKRPLEALIAARIRLTFPVSSGEIGLSPGVVDTLIAHLKLTARGESGLDKRTDFRLAPVDETTTSIEYGSYTVGRVPNDRVTEVKDLFLKLLSEVITREEHDEMGRLFSVLDQLKRKLHDELLIIILRRVVPGRCRYCPL